MIYVEIIIKVVFADKNEASRCIEEIRYKGEKRRWKLEGKYTASDFMICVSHFPLGNFIILYTVSYKKICV